MEEMMVVVGGGAIWGAVVGVCGVCEIVVVEEGVYWAVGRVEREGEREEVDMIV